MAIIAADARRGSRSGDIIPDNADPLQTLLGTAVSGDQQLLRRKRVNAIRAWWVWKAILWRRARRLLPAPELPTRSFIRTGDVDGKPAAGGIKSPR